jgi:hypothetical protein
VTRKESKDPDKEEKLNAFEKFFNQLGERKKSKDDDEGDKDDKKKKKTVLVWFESPKLLVSGDEGMVEEVGKVIEGEGQPRQAQRDLRQGQVAGRFVDARLRRPRGVPQEIKKDFFDSVGPVTGSMRFTDPGLLVSAHIDMAGKKVSKKELLPETVALSLYEKVPATTVAYLAFSTKFGVDGKEMEKLIKKSYSDVDERGAEEIEKALDGMKDNLGFGLADVFDSLGDEAIIAVTADDKLAGLAFEKDKTALEHGSVIVIFALDKTDGKDNAEKIIKKLKGTIEEKAKGEIELKKTDGGFVATPGDRAKTAMGGVDASFSIAIEEDKYMVVIVGTKKRIDEANEALGGSETLKNDKAHKKALTAFEGKPLAVLWVDAGRIAKAIMKESKDVKSAMKDAGVPTDALVLEGDERITAGYAVRAEWKDDTLSVDFDTLNLPVFAAVSVVPLFFARKQDSSSEPFGGEATGGSGGGSRCRRPRDRGSRRRGLVVVSVGSRARSLFAERHAGLRRAAERHEGALSARGRGRGPRRRSRRRQAERTTRRGVRGFVRARHGQCRALHRRCPLGRHRRPRGASHEPLRRASGGRAAAFVHVRGRCRARARVEPLRAAR